MKGKDIVRIGSSTLDVKRSIKENIPAEEIRASFSVPKPDGISKAGHGPKSFSTGFKNAIKKFDGDFPVGYIPFKINNTLPSGNYGIPDQDPFHLFDTGPWDIPPIPLFVPNSTDFNTFLGHNMMVKKRFAKGNLLSCGCSEIHIGWYSPWSNPISSLSYKTEMVYNIRK
ncbi:hypothetical protein L0P88_08195 [Muricauda sp. SCSIO 64092]|uniref:hypothetical protein n=1 Tax=Allomuricauda sp. SCSIO 64092 TaxID=2908842 RepID=UPI001FF529F0|nr:hypothetical protein [Muricauda sp. SCSIO 64092]UOY08522.1 hypothetical protein L0P88_08195 [Muricauda sp. SCSIO 64092]